VRVYDYSSPGAYFITVCAHDRACLFGDIADEVVSMNDAGRIVDEEWRRTSAIRKDVSIDAYVVMPNHFHGIVVLHDCRGTARRAPTVERFGRPVAGSVPTIVRAFKSAATKRINEFRNTPGAHIWQRNYYEHIVRDDDELNRIRQYIVDNPARWSQDRENPAAAKTQRPGQAWAV
jgi:REP element-mobilizing transposase RayT